MRPRGRTSRPARTGTARANRRRDRRQRRHRARNGATSARRGSRRRSSPAGIPSACSAPRASSARCAPRPSTPRSGVARAVLPGPADADRPRDGHRRRPHYGRLLEIDVEQARRAIDEHLLLALEVARNAAGKVRPGGTLLFMGGTGGRRPAVGLAHRRRRSPPRCPRSSPTWRSSSRRSGSTSSPPASSTRRCRRRSSAIELDSRRDQLRATLPIRRVVGPADVAALAVHIMINTALTGATYDIDGGQQLVAR